MRPRRLERLLRRAGDDLGAQVEQHQQVAQVGGEERHLVGAGDQDALRAGDRVDRGLDLGARRLARGLLDVDVVGGDRGLELALVQREQRRRAGRRRAVAGLRPAATRRRYSSRAGLWSSGKPSKPSACEKRTTVERRGVRAARELLGGLEGDLVQVVDDVLRDVLLGARELVEPRLDVGGKGLVSAAAVGRGGGGQLPCASWAEPLFDGAGGRSSKPAMREHVSMASTERRVLLAPAAIARAAARMAKEPEQRWMLQQSPAVRRSYAEEVLDATGPGAANAEELWMLRQPRTVRLSFISQVLKHRRPLPRQEIWMLRQNDPVRQSYVRDVLAADAAD